MMAPNTMMMPCMVVNWLNSSGFKNCKPGWNNSARMPNAKHPANHQHGQGEQQVQRPDVLCGWSHGTTDASHGGGRDGGRRRDHRDGALHSLRILS